MRRLLKNFLLLLNGQPGEEWQDFDAVLFEGTTFESTVQIVCRFHDVALGRQEEENVAIAMLKEFPNSRKDRRRFGFALGEIFARKIVGVGGHSPIVLVFEQFCNRACIYTMPFAFGGPQFQLFSNRLVP